ncbi:hypothetical protein V5179_16010 [Vreelandella titanicae]
MPATVSLAEKMGVLLERGALLQQRCRRSAK